MDYLENFKSRFENYCKKTREVPKARECIVENLLTTRRTTRAQFLTERRNIVEEPPSPSPILIVLAENLNLQKSPPKKMDRLARMQQWKSEKLKKLEEQKAKMKPTFKVGAKEDVGFPKIEQSKQINKKSFAPRNHVFKPPVNVKAIDIVPVKKPNETFKRVTRSQKTAAAVPISLPSRTRKKQEPAKNEETQYKINKNTLLRQNAFDHISNETNKTETVTKVKVKKGNGRNKENISSNIDDGTKITEAKSKRRSLRNTKIENQKSPEKIILNEETSKKRTSLKRKSIQKSYSETEDNTKTETTNKRQSRRKSFRKSTSNAKKESDLNSTYELNSDDATTPVKDDVFSPVPVAAYISPFVTTSRGKGSIKKENKERSIRGLPSFTEFNTPDEEANSSFQITGASYFHTTLNNEISRLTSMCKTWNTYKENSTNLPEDAIDLIDVAVGQANLLMNKKFQQFRKLIVSCENGYGEEKPVTCEDLQGFWDMIFIQVENLNTRFNRLTELKNRNWQEIIPTVHQKIVKKGGNKKRIKSASTSSLRAAIEAARKKTKSASSVEDTVFNGGFFVVKSPQKTPEKTKTPVKDRRNLLKTVLSSETRKSSRKTVGTPGVNMMKASQLAKSVENLNFTLPTPGKSILKKATNRTSIVHTSSKAVLFKDYDSESE